MQLCALWGSCRPHLVVCCVRIVPYASVHHPSTLHLPQEILGQSLRMQLFVRSSYACCALQFAFIEDIVLGTLSMKDEAGFQAWIKDKVSDLHGCGNAAVGPAAGNYWCLSCCMWGPQEQQRCESAGTQRPRPHVCNRMHGAVPTSWHAVFPSRMTGLHHWVSTPTHGWHQELLNI